MGRNSVSNDLFIASDHQIIVSINHWYSADFFAMFFCTFLIDWTIVCRYETIKNIAVWKCSELILGLLKQYYIVPCIWVHPHITSLAFPKFLDLYPKYVSDLVLSAQCLSKWINWIISKSNHNIWKKILGGFLWISRNTGEGKIRKCLFF